MLPTEALTAGGSVIFAGLVWFVAVARGWIRTPREVADKDRQIARLEAAVEKLTEQRDKLMLGNETAMRLMRAVEELAERADRP